MPDALLRAFGWSPLLIHGDPCVLDRWLWVRRHLRGGPARTFDAGAGNGAFSIYAARRGNTVVSATFSEREQQDARRRAESLGVEGIDFRIIDLRELDAHLAALGRFDQIICLETIEHISDDARLLRTLAELLQPGGRLLLSTPFDAHRPLYREQADPSPLEDGSHVRFGYSEERLRRLIEQAGLEVAEVGYVSGFVSQKVTNLMRRLTARLGVAAAWLLVLPLRPLVVLDAPLTRVLGYPHLSIAALAGRPG
jgi:SAM-dependent methyltransferase